MQQIDLLTPIIVDNFAGGGGASTGIELATGIPVTIAINHDPDAIAMHRANHPYTEHYQESVWDIDPIAVCRGRHVGLAWFSPDCKHFSKAKGGKPVEKKIRGLAWIVLRWAGTVRPDLIILENVEEFQTWGPVRKGKPVKRKSGQTFRKFIFQLEALGYAVEWRELVAADYGAPTTRKRFFLIARCDGKPIVWPKPTHAPRDSAAVKSGQKKPWRSAAEIIDWSLPCPSIFDTRAEVKAKYGLTAQRPLRPNTLRRVVRGVDKFVIKSADPFLVIVNHAGKFRGQELAEPLQTITAKHGYGVASPVMAPLTMHNNQNAVGTAITDPVNTITGTGAGGHQMLITPTLTAIGQTGGGDRCRSVEEPSHTQVSKAEECVVCPAMIQYHTEQSEKVRGQAVTEPIITIDASNRYGIAAASLTKYYGSDQHGQDVAEPLHTIAAGGTHHGLVVTRVEKMAPGADLHRWTEIRQLLNEYCDYHLADDEVILFDIGGDWYYMADIGLRMLTPRELYRANGFPDDYIIDRDYLGNEYGKSKQVARCGNAVPPPFAAALVRANLPDWCKGKDIKTMRDLTDCVAV